MERVTGIGGIFFKADDPKKLQAWYEEKLGIPAEGGYVMFQWREANDPERTGQTVWSLFPRDTKYFAPSSSPFMLNYRVENLDAMLDQLRQAGAQVDDRVEEMEYGRFGWVIDPEGNRIELWEPPDQNRER